MLISVGKGLTKKGIKTNLIVPNISLPFHLQSYFLLQQIFVQFSALTLEKTKRMFLFQNSSHYILIEYQFLKYFHQ